MTTKKYNPLSTALQLCLLLVGMCLSVVQTQAQTTTRNYVHTKTYTKENKESPLEVIRYFDGLGRPVQEVHKGMSPTLKDLVTLQEYDAAGREVHAWLPVESANTNGAFVAPATLKSRAWTFYRDSAYSRPIYEPSPLGRVTEQYGPGRQWYTNKKSVRTSYLTNNTTDTLVCARYELTENGGTQALQKNGNYARATLRVQRIQDEEGHTTFLFTDSQDRLILSRQIDRSGQTKILHDTYYVYDRWNNLCYVLPPLATDALTANLVVWDDQTTPALQQYGYSYRYDHRNRCIYKKLPGAAHILYIYDQADRLIFTQDGERRNLGEWLFSIPDAGGRTALTGVCRQQIADENYLAGQTVTAVPAPNDELNHYYAIQGITLSTPKVYTADYYDGYHFLSSAFAGGLAYEEMTGFLSQRYDRDYEHHTARGLLTGRKVGQVTDGTKVSYSYQAYYYNAAGQVIQKRAKNQLDGQDNEFTNYDFAGRPIHRKRVHTALGKPTQTENYRYFYDRAGRPKQILHKLNNGEIRVLAKNLYDPVGRLIKKTHDYDGLIPWEFMSTPPPAALSADFTPPKLGHDGPFTSEYTYNVRSWITSHTNEYLTENLTYRYNGNISAHDRSIRAHAGQYDYTYDHLSSLKAARYSGDGAFAASYTYDKQGNLRTIRRDGTRAPSAFGVVDNLTLSYTGNQLRNVNDAGPNVTFNASADFKDYTKGSGTEYTYNTNGALVKDLNKGICNITYNYLHLPRTLDMKNPMAETRTTYTYSADGALLTRLQQWNSAPSATATPGSAINPSSLDKSLKTDYVGNKVYENGVLKRILVDNGYIENGIYHFYVKDYLGNNRVVVDQNSKLVQSNMYYPFGMPFADMTATEQGKQPYKFGGKELDQLGGLNLYDYHARQHDPALGRFTTMDPLAEMYYSTSPYVYCANNPVRFIDPTGLAWRPTYDRSEGIDAINGYEWVDEGESYNEDGSLKNGLYAQAIFFSTNFGNKAFNKDSKFNMGSSTATVYLADGTTMTFDATTEPANSDIHATVPEGFYEADFGLHRGYQALNMRDKGTPKGSRRIELGRVHPSDPNRTYAEYINIHWAGRDNVTGKTQSGKYVSEGCLLIDINSWGSFINLFNTKAQRKNVVGVGVSRTLSTPVNEKRLVTD